AARVAEERRDEPIALHLGLDLELNLRTRDEARHEIGGREGLGRAASGRREGALEAQGRALGRAIGAAEEAAAAHPEDLPERGLRRLEAEERRRREAQGGRERARLAALARAQRRAQLHRALERARPEPAEIGAEHDRAALAIAAAQRRDGQ